MLMLILFGPIGLVPDEAQYWTWAQNLDWGYYSKPPAIAWQIWLGCQFLGNTEVGIRISAVTLSFFIALATWHLARSAGCSRTTARLSAIAIALSPAGFLSSLMSTTDGGLLLFWTLASAEVANALSRGRPPNALLLGTLIGLGALFKWNCFLFWPLLLLFMLPFPYLRDRKIFFGIALSLVALIPSLIWNLEHDFATFRHVWTQSTGGTSHAPANPFDFIAAQALLFSPLLFLFVLIALGKMLVHLREVWPAILFCGGSGLLLLGSFTVAAFFQKIQGNWVLFAYPGLTTLTAWVLSEWRPKQKNWLQGAIALSLLLSLIGLSLPILQQLPYRYNPFVHNLGWRTLSPILTKAGYDPSEHFLFSDTYQMSSLLSFYGPEQQRAYFLNLEGRRNNQFSYWPPMKEEQLGNDGFFAIADKSARLTDRKIQEKREALGRYFAAVTPLGRFPLVLWNGTVEKELVLFFCEQYNGKEPPRSILY